MKARLPAKRGGPPPRTAPIKHGLFVRAAEGLRLRDRKVTRLARRMQLVMPWLEPSDLPMARGWAELEVLAGMVYAHLHSVGVIDNRGESRRLLDDYRKLRATQVVLSRELGLSPAARMAIKASGTKAALDLAAAFSARDEGNDNDPTD